MDRIIEKLDGSERFIETKSKDWRRRLAAWKKNHAKPCPMPAGHLMFKDPAAYRCRLV